MSTLETHIFTPETLPTLFIRYLNMTPADARFAKGEELTAHNGMRVQLRRPLDFLVVSDHSEYLGGYYRFNVNDPIVTGTAAGEQWQDFVDEGDPNKMMGPLREAWLIPQNTHCFKDAQKLI